MITNPIYQSFSQLLRCPINHIALVGQNSSQFYFCLGRHSFIIINKTLNDIINEVFYAHIVKIIMDTNSRFYVEIQLSENRDQNLPAKMVIETEDRKSLVDWITTSYKTDHMFRMGKVCELPVFIGKLSKGLPEQSTIPTLKIPEYLMKTAEDEDTKKLVIKGYRFNLPCDATLVGDPENTWNITFDKTLNMKKAYTRLSVQVGDDLPIVMLKDFGGRNNLEFYAEEYIHKLWRDEPFTWIVHSNPYHKRINLTEDTAAWIGWEVLIRTPEKEAVLIILRRKFMPPLLENFRDFFLLNIGPFTTMSPATYTEKSGCFRSTQSLLTTTRNVADSITGVFTVCNAYDDLLTEGANALLYDEDTLSHLHFRLKKKIYPDVLPFAVLFVQFIARELSKWPEEEYKLDAIDNLLERKYGKLGTNLDKNKALKREELLKRGDWKEVVAYLSEDLRPAGATDKAKEDDFKDTWPFKIARYLTHCLDGGLLPQKLVLADLIPQIMSQSGKIPKNFEDPTIILDYLLYFTEKKDIFKTSTYLKPTTSAPSPLRKFADNYTEYLKRKQDFFINERMLLVCIQEGYAQILFSKSAKPSNYYKFLWDICETTNDPALKIAVCSRIINSYIEGENTTPPMDAGPQEIQRMVTLLMNMYGNFYSHLSEYAASALINLSYGKKEAKTFIMNESGSRKCIEKLNARDHKVLNRTLMLIEILLKVPQTQEELLNLDVTNKVIGILSKSRIPGVVYQEEVYLTCFRILKLIVMGQADARTTVLKNLEMIHTYLAPNISDDLRGQIFSLYEELAKKEEHVQHIADISIDYIITNASQFQERGREKALKLVLAFKDVPHFVDRVNASSDFKKALDNWKGLGTGIQYLAKNVSRAIFERSTVDTTKKSTSKK